jgi:Tfp pilus assembly protein PilN
LTQPPPIPGPLAAVGADARDYLAAYAAAVSDRSAPLCWRPERSTARIPRVWRVTAGAILLAAASVGALVAPGVRDDRFVRAVASELARTKPIELEITRRESELRRVSQLLAHIESFRAQRGQMSRLLGELSRSLPESTAIVTLRVDSLEGSFVALAPHVTDVLPTLAQSRLLVFPRIVGAVTRENVGAAKLERAAFRFRRRR